jgi:hypothetical protein
MRAGAGRTGTSDGGRKRNEHAATSSSGDGGLEALYDRIMPRTAPPPPPDLEDLDHALDCELSIEPKFDELAEEAMAAGWSEDDVDAALLSLARHRILARIERERTGRQFKVLMRQ